MGKKQIAVIAIKANIHCNTLIPGFYFSFQLVLVIELIFLPASAFYLPCYGIM
jgi:hypothetical protein